MKSFRIAVISIVALALIEAAWWASKNYAHPVSSSSSPQTQSAIAPKHLLTAVNAPQSSAAVTPVSTTRASPSGSAIANGSGPDDTEQKLGQFSISGAEYTIVLKKKKRQPGSTQETGETVVGMEIRDGRGNLAYQRAFPYQGANTADNEFSDAWSVAAGVLSGAHGTGLWVSYDLDSEPSAPEPEPSGWVQIFGVVDGKFKAFSGPILVQGEVMQDSNTGKNWKTAGALDANSDALNFKVWAHHFRLIYPVRIDWSHGTLSPALSCGQTASGALSPCRYSVFPETERRAGDLTFIQICPEASVCDHPERIVVKGDSKLELLACAADVHWDAGRPSPPSGSNPMEDQGGITVGNDNLYLLVHIDSRQGWIHSDEDFNALGLPFEQ